jgi:hypothetical protein
LFRGIKKACAILLASGVLVSHAIAADVVTTYKDEAGWKLQVNGEDFFVKGVVWGYTPRDENYNYNLWGQPDEFVRKVLDYEFGLMQAAGVNAIRSFNFMPPKWVTYVYREFGIMVAINPLVGRYGAVIDGRYIEFTDYSDPRTREFLKAESLALVEKYKNVDGVLMFAFGNESNYGLSWSSFEIENLPVGEQNREKAKYLYSLFNEIMAEGKKIAPNHPFTIVNGDLQYIDLIAEYCTDMDLLGINAYRGNSFTTLWEEVDQKLDLPVLFFEFGSDAYNARTGEEDQLNQALIIKDQWREMYHKSYGNGEEGNAIGGFQFEWRDEWWKYLQEERLDIHDTNASWANGGYPHDFVDGQNNMNEEWWGITQLGTVNEDGIYEANPRMAYDVLAEVWKIDPYTHKKAAINRDFDDINMEYIELKGDVRELKVARKEDRKLLYLTGGSLNVKGVLKADEANIDDFGDDGDEFSDGQMVFVDFGFNPTKDLEGQFTINLLGNVANQSPIELAYGDRGQPVTVQVTQEFDGIDGEVTVGREFRDRERIEIYDFDSQYQGKYFDLDAFYHTPRYHWKYEGDFFGLVREATDIAGQDIYNSKAPYGVEFATKEATETEGFKFVVGPEIYWGANPKWIAKWQSSFGKVLPFVGDGVLGKTEFSVIYFDDLDRGDNAVAATGPTTRETRAGTLYTKTSFNDDWSLELGAIWSADEKEGEEYTKFVNGETRLDTVDDEDSFGFKAKLNFPLLGGLAYVGGHYAGLVAAGGDPLKEFGTRLPYSDLGNKREIEAGILLPVGNWWFFPRFLTRDNLIDANPLIEPDINDPILNPGSIPRNTDDDPFAVLDNREVDAYEFFITYDPTGATGFYQWDNDMREDARFAFNIGLNYHEQPTITDSYQFFFEPTNEDIPFGVGLPDQDIWIVSSRSVWNPTTKWRLIANIERSQLQSTGDPTGGTRTFWDLDGKVVYDNKHILAGYYKEDAFGPYDFQRQFNITFPRYWALDYKFLMDPKKSEKNSSHLGLRYIWRKIDDDSRITDPLDRDNDYQWQLLAYYTMNFGGTNPPEARF